MANATDWTATQALEEISSGRISAVDYTDALLAQCEAHSDLNAFIHLDADQARKKAAASASDGGPLSGLPIPVKDNFNTDDMPTTGGTPGLRSNRPKANAAVVQKLVDAGAFIFGKLNMHELAFGVQNNNAAFGDAHNPYDRDRMPGGSSGGTGVAIAARMAPVGFGTDTGGSVRIPAGLCGVAGFRPTLLRYDQAGIVPISNTRDTAGPLARSVADIALMDSVITGDDTALTSVDLNGLRIGVPRDHFYDNLHPETARLAEEALSALQKAGVVLVEASIPQAGELDEAGGFPIALFETVTQLKSYLSSTDLSLDFEGLVAQVASPDVKGMMDAIVSGEGAVPESVYLEALNNLRPALQKNYADYFSDNNLAGAIFPTTPLPAAPIADAETTDLNGEQVPVFPAFIKNTGPGSVAGIPGLSLPSGLTSSGLPVGMELDGPVGSDRTLLAIGAAMEQVLPETPPPAL